MQAKMAKAFAAMMQDNTPGKRWARPEEPILHNLNDEKEEPHVFFHNINYRTSRKYINIEKIKVCLGGVLGTWLGTRACQPVCSKGGGLVSVSMCEKVMC